MKSTKSNNHPSRRRKKIFTAPLITTLMTLSVLFFFIMGFADTSAEPTAEPIADPPAVALSQSDERPSAASSASTAASVNEKPSEAVVSAEPLAARLQEVSKEFSKWADQNPETPDLERDARLEEGVELARKRRAIMLRLIQTDPEAALSAAVSQSERSELPKEIQEQLETIISARAPLDLVQTCFHTDPEMCSHEHELKRETFIDGRSYRVHVYGSRLNDLSIPETSLNGIALDGHLAVSDSRVNVLSRDAALSQGLFLNTPEAVAVEANGEFTILSSIAELDAFEESILNNEENPTYYANDSGDGTSGHTSRPQQAWATGAKRLLVIRVDFSDLPGPPIQKSSTGIPARNAPITEDDVDELINGVNGVREFYQDSSFGKTDLILAPAVNGDSPDVTEVLRMPQPASYYSNTGNSGPLISDARNAASVAGYTLSDYDRICTLVTNLANFDGGTKFNSFGGRASVGGDNMIINGYWDFRVVAHELGHNWGLRHANLWKVTDGNAGSQTGSSQAYGDSYDTMGADSGSHLKHFSPWGKSLLWWIPDSQVTLADISNTYRVYRFDHGDADLTLPRALKIVRDDTRDYWISYRRADSSTSMYNGAYVQWGYNSRKEGDLLDMNTPNSDIDDAALEINQTYTDPSGDIQFTPIAQGGSGAEEWIDIQVVIYQPQIEFATDSIIVNSDVGLATLNVNRTQDSEGSVSVNYTTFPGTATTPDDFTATSGTLTWADGEMTSKTIQVPIIATGPPNEPTEAFTVQLSLPVGGVIGANETATVTIIGNNNKSPLVNAGNDQTIALSGSSWSPLIMTPQLWLDAQDSSTLTLSGNSVSQWNDKTTHGRHATASGTARPTATAAALNGKRVLTFDGSSDVFNVDLDFLAGVSHSAFVVTKPTNYRYIYGAANAGQGNSSLHVGFVDDNYRMNYWGNKFTSARSANFVSGSANIMNFVWRTGTGKQIFANGKLDASNTDAGNIGVMSGGGRIGRITGNNYFGGDIAEMIILTGTVDLEGRESIEGYLAHKWGLDDQLSNNHQYKLLPPGGGTAVANLSGSASDPDGDVVTTTWSLDSGPEIVTFGNVNALNTTATFSQEGVYVLRLTASDGILESSSLVTITVTPAELSIYDAWAGGTFTNPFTDNDPGADPDGDQMTNRTELAFGTDPTLQDGLPLKIDGSAHGLPVVVESPTGIMELYFVRRDDHGTSGSFSYVPQFNSDLGVFHDSPAIPIFVVDSGVNSDYEIVKVPYTTTLPDGKPARFGRVKISDVE